jgi:hypothetical protein
MTDLRQVEDIKLIAQRFERNLARAQALTEAAEGISGFQEGQDTLNVVDEILRMLVVFMHAVLEDGLRELLRVRLGKSPESVLDAIPLAGTSLMNQPRKFLLGALQEHRDKTVEALIEESVNEYLDHKSFSSTDDIAAMLGWVGADLSQIRGHFPMLDEAISRRHQIVHRADMELVGGDWRPALVDDDEIIKWAVNTGVFFTKVSLLMAYPERGPTFESGWAKAIAAAEELELT